MLYPCLILAHIPTLVIALTLLIGTIFSYLGGVSLGRYQRRKHPEAKSEGVGPQEGALLGLLALLLSFTFGMSAARYDNRRNVIIKEVNTIEAAYLRTHMYPDSMRGEFKKDFRDYVEARIAYREAGIDETKIKETLDEARKIFGRIWQRAAGFAQGAPTAIPHILVIPMLNEMIDVVLTREAARTARVPENILWLLVILTLLGSSIIGYSKKEKKNDWIILSVYAFMTSITVYTIIDLDRPRQGMITNDDSVQRIIELRHLFDE